MLKLNDNQKRAVFDINENCIVSASPGTGKTRTLVARALCKIENLPKHKSLALITYTNAAADEIDNRITTNKDIFIGTIHSFCLEYILRPFGWIYSWNKPIVISYDQQQTFFDNNEDIDLGDFMLDELGKLKKNLNGELNTNVEWNHNVSLETVAERYYDFQNEIKVIDFNEILYRSYKIINENEFIAKSLSSKFYEILVDEFQDTNLYQYEILKKINYSGECRFFMVGDEKQKIFSFAGAIDNAFDNALHDFDAQIAELVITYRSTNNIINTYSSLFEDHPILENESPYSGLNINVKFYETKKRNHEQYLIGIVKDLIEVKNIDLSEIAILSTNWYSAYDVSKVLRHKYNIVGLGALPHKKNINSSSYRLFKALSRFYFSQTNKNIKSIRRNIDLHIIENNLDFTTRSKFFKTNKLITEFLRISQENNIAEGIAVTKVIFDSIFKISHSSFNEILKLISEEEKNIWSFGDYINTLAEINGITNNNIHKVKGLEFDAVILNQINENKIPYQKLLDRSSWTYEELTEQGIKDGRNLFYVALSRAKKYLIILHNWKPSMFIEIVQNT